LRPTAKNCKARRIFALIAIAFIVALVSIAAFVHVRRAPAPQPLTESKLSLSPSDRILIMAPHPDDEALGCGGVIQQAVAMSLPVRIVFLTNGDFNELSFMVYRKELVLNPTSVEGMGLLRHDEAVAADSLLGVSTDQQDFLGYPDFGTITIFESHWGGRPPYRSLLTRADAVPYPSAYRPGAPYKGEEILADLEKIIRDFMPTKIFLSHPGDQHPDHQAMYLFTRIALWDLRLSPEPVIYPYLVHFSGWPRPTGYHPDAPLYPPASSMNDIPWFESPLTPAQTETKRSAIMAHKSQYDSGPPSMLAYARSDELFGDFPDVMLAALPTSTKITDTPQGYSHQAPDQLTPNERASFLGFEERTVQVSGGNLEVAISFTRPVGRDVGISVYFFGYRSDRPFAEMPKLHVRFGAIEHVIMDRDTVLPFDSINVTRESRRITMSVPLHLIGDPERILTGAKSYLGDIPFDWISWRVLDLNSGTTR
jgi:LmbE family N-acetylglucosaminyl deacetylase